MMVGARGGGGEEFGLELGKTSKVLHNSLMLKIVRVVLSGSVSGVDEYF